jgi:hypothetical protein
LPNSLTGRPIHELDDDVCSNSGEHVMTDAKFSTNQNLEHEELTKTPSLHAEPSEFRQRRPEGRKLSKGTSIERVASSLLVLGSTPSQSKSRPKTASTPQQLDLPHISSQATIGRNSQFQNLTQEDRDLLGGLEYRALRLLLKIVIGKRPRATLFHRC